MRTVPVPVNVRFVPSPIAAGPPFVANVTGNPEPAVALNPTWFVVS